jgi:hypothetical protein
MRHKNQKLISQPQSQAKQNIIPQKKFSTATVAAKINKKDGYSVTKAAPIIIKLRNKDIEVTRPKTCCSLKNNLVVPRGD